MNKTTQPVFVFERKQLTTKVSPFGEKYGPYLYRDTTDNTSLATWVPPTKPANARYKGQEIGYGADALYYCQTLMNKTSQPVFVFERKRLGSKTVSSFGEKYGPYLYRDTTDNTLLASWDPPTKPPGSRYKGEDVGYNTDALYYYKN